MKNLYHQITDTQKSQMNICKETEAKDTYYFWLDLGRKSKIPVKKQINKDDFRSLNSMF